MYYFWTAESASGKPFASLRLPDALVRINLMKLRVESFVCSAISARSPICASASALGSESSICPGASDRAWIAFTVSLIRSGGFRLFPKPLPHFECIRIGTLSCVYAY